MIKSKSFMAAAFGLAVASFFAGSASAQAPFNRPTQSYDQALQRANDVKNQTTDSGLASYRYDRETAPNAFNRDQQYIGRYNR